MKLRRDAWDRFCPLLAHPPEIRTMVHTTNMIETINFQLRKRETTRIRLGSPSVSPGEEIRLEVTTRRSGRR